MVDMSTHIGANIKRMRKRNGFTQEHIAQYLSIDQTLVSKIESGQRSIGVSALEKLCDLLFCTLDDLIDNQTTMPSGKTIAFRADGFSTEDLQAIAAIGRIVRNLEDMTSLEKMANHDA